MKIEIKLVGRYESVIIQKMEESKGGAGRVENVNCLVEKNENKKELSKTVDRQCREEKT